MDELSVEAVAELLRAAGLVGPSIDPKQVAADLNASTRSAATLHELTADHLEVEPVSFDPRWR